MTTHKLPQKKKKAQKNEHPLADLEGKFGGELWEATLEEIKRFREAEKEEINKILDSSLDDK
ncbi:hypothetical protein DSM106972_003990 [Dulcicalothrix desertica PCC 7102]|uniref:Uncharacterized protein n=1 Tax=Dulcicalothrix desertica PCC 7102 TaxID=232991 RepID=A0A433VUY9_9CYAN|nr:hypothetical protein [Dulcicalothrix desertica]RUT09904.1 hypothetical protein DSM106972_003990 [Dulcicalothrix desertica PCC 7102]TWH51088.1 hypothetical protein CAL7102_05459 [Dulcicalothrix desertica PCC 7102]TWH51095.1 hypothetical protein CAL7102_05469 [Dulcicalothrix desertica PCC 7102]